jgi:Protein of unknown function (DUF3307)
MASLGYTFAILYAVFIMKHLVADFLLQTTWMAQGKERSSDWLAPLSVHSAVHAVLTGTITVAVAPALWWLTVVDFLIHATIDRSKGVVTKRLGVAPFTDARWWWIFGIDQSLHQLTHLGYAVVLMSA